MDAAEEEAKRSSARDEAPAEETEQPKKTNKRLIPDLPPVRPKCLTEEQRLRARAVLVIVGGLLIEFTLGSHYTFSNMSPYIASYIRVNQDQSYTTGKASFIMWGNQCTHGIGMVIGGVIERYFGPKCAALLGSLIFVAGVTLTAIAIKISPYFVIFTYGIMYGLGKGMAYVMPLSCGMKWYSDRKGLAAGIVLTAYGLGAFAFNSLITFYINPNNAKPAAGTRYFTDPAVIERIPKVFPVLGVVYAIILVVGSLMMCHPPKQEQVALDDPSSKENTQKGDEPMRESHLDDITDPKSSRERVASLGGGSVEKIAGEDGEKVDIVTGDSSLSPRQTVQAYEFYLLFFTFFFNQQGIGYMATMSKDFGLSFIKDDKFLGIVAAVSAVASSLCRSIWGGLSDKVGYRLAMFIVTGLLVIELVIFAFTPEMGMYAYGVMMVVIYFTFPGTQALLPSCTAQTFGPTFTSSNYGMIYWAPAFGQGLSAVISAFIAPLLGDKGTIFLIAALVSVTIALTFFYHKKPSPELIRERKGWPATDD